LACEFHFAGTERASTAWVALPTQKEADQLPHGVEAEAARHHRIILEVTVEKPQFRVDIEFGNDAALAVLPIIGTDVGDAIDHQHVVFGKLRVTWPEQFSVTAGDEFLFGVTGLCVHRHGGLVVQVEVASGPQSGAPGCIGEVLRFSWGVRPPKHRVSVWESPESGDNVPVISGEFGCVFRHLFQMGRRLRGQVGVTAY